MSLITDAIFVQALRSNSALMQQLADGDVYNTTIALPDEELDNAVSLARKAWKRVGHNGNLFQSRRKVIASLLRKGYDLDTAKSACNAAEDIK